MKMKTEGKGGGGRESNGIKNKEKKNEEKEGTTGDAK
jgi:hypothetical protein